MEWINFAMDGLDQYVFGGSNCHPVLFLPFMHFLESREWQKIVVFSVFPFVPDLCLLTK